MAPNAPKTRPSGRDSFVTKIWNQRFPMSVRNARDTSDAMTAINATFHTAYGRASTKSSQKKVRSSAARAETDRDRLLLRWHVAEADRRVMGDEGHRSSGDAGRDCQCENAFEEAGRVALVVGRQRQDRRRDAHGMPMTKVDNSVIWRGRNGKARPTSAVARTMTRLMTFFVTQRMATRSTLAMTRRPLGQDPRHVGERVPSRSTTWATVLVAGAALPMARPRVTPSR
jgi:hypothetical protein